jgi:hypothetical protein
MRVRPWNLIFLVGFIAYVGIRGVFERRTSGIEKTINRMDTRERILLPFVGLGSLLLPILYLFTPWLAFARLSPSDSGAIVRHRYSGVRAVALLAIPCRFGPKLVEDVGATPRTSVGPAWRLPFSASSDVCLDPALGSRPGIAAAKLARWVVSSRDFCGSIFSSGSSRRTNDVRVLWAGMS